ncbi:MAG TPA: hypothetical protein VKU82_14920 [Planctomycetaceae bacterium]|nr:hypothetical protein [Planctomycetaceae bacterium]
MQENEVLQADKLLWAAVQLLWAANKLLCAAKLLCASPHVLRSRSVVLRSGRIVLRTGRFVRRSGPRNGECSAAAGRSSCAEAKRVTLVAEFPSRQKTGFSCRCRR